MEGWKPSGLCFAPWGEARTLLCKLPPRTFLLERGSTRPSYCPAPTSEGAAPFTSLYCVRNTGSAFNLK